jgi:hypothetical protein
VDFERALREIDDFLDRRGTPWAVIGGLSLAALGFPRSTLDLDVVVSADAQDELVAHLEAEGFRTLHRSPGYSNHQHPDPVRGRIDVVYVRGETAEKLFASTLVTAGPRGMVLRVPKPEHLIAMKVLAIKNDPERLHQDLADIRLVLELPGVDVDEVRATFARHGLDERFDELRAE